MKSIQRCTLVSLLLVFASLHAGAAPPQPEERAVNHLVALEKQFEEAMVRGDIEFLDKLLQDDFTFTHGDGWIGGGDRFRTDDKALTLELVKHKPYAYRTPGDIQVELHDDIAITKGSYTAQLTRNGVTRRFSVNYIRVYVLRSEGWRLVSHLTVDGPHYLSQSK